MVNYKIILGLFLMMSSCTCSDDELQLQRMDYGGSELRTDGYYYSEFQSDVPRFDIYFFYKNGIVIYGDTPPVSEISIREENYKDGTFYEKIKDLKYHWGVFKVLGDEIEIERWYVVGPPLETFVRFGSILNDSTFHITSFSRPDGSDTEVRDEMFHFKALSPKPDSTNMFIP